MQNTLPSPEVVFVVSSLSRPLGVLTTMVTSLLPGNAMVAMDVLPFTPWQQAFPLSKQE